MNDDVATENKPAEVAEPQAQPQPTQVDASKEVHITLPAGSWLSAMQLIDQGTRASNGQDVLLIGGSLLKEMREQIAKQVKDSQ